MTDPAAPTPPAPRAATRAVRSVATLALGLWMAAAVQAFTPDLPHAGLDASWVAAMGEFADRGLRWGRDLAFTYGPASPLVTHYGNDAYLPLTLPLLVAATVDLRPTTLGRLAGLLYRPARSTLTVALADGTRRSYRFVSGLGRSGFVLTPLVTDAAEFQALAEARPAPPGRRVVSFAVSGNPALLSPEVAYTLQPLSPAAGAAAETAASALPGAPAPP